MNIRFHNQLNHAKIYETKSDQKYSSTLQNIKAEDTFQELFIFSKRKEQKQKNIHEDE